MRDSYMRPLYESADLGKAKSSINIEGLCFFGRGKTENQEHRSNHCGRRGKRFGGNVFVLPAGFRILPDGSPKFLCRSVFKRCFKCHHIRHVRRNY